MGISRFAFKLLLTEAQRRPFNGHLLTLGRQDIHLSYKDMRKAARQLGFPLSDSGPATPSSNPIMAARGYVSDTFLFKALGFTEVTSIDYSDYEGCDRIFDLNSLSLPENLVEAVDVVVDGGTIEHLFHIPNALNNIFRMLKPNGRVIYFSPASNHLDHGFYTFSPTLFWDYYTANQFELNRLQLGRTSIAADVDPCTVYDYQPGCLRKLMAGELDDAVYYVICIATKTKDSTGDKIPQQTIYTELWQGENAAPDRWYTFLKNRVKHSRFLFTMARRVWKRVHPKGPGLKAVDRL